MRYLLIALALMCGTTTMAQTEEDYRTVIEKFQEYYNHAQVDSIISLYSDQWGDKKYKLWSAERHQELMDEFGKMKTYKYVTERPDAVLFKVGFEKSLHMMGILLDVKGKVLNFRFKTSSPEIDSMLMAH